MIKRLAIFISLLLALVLPSWGSVTFTSKIHEKDAGQATSLATSSWAPTASQPVWMMVSSGRASSPVNTPTVTGNGMTWVLIVSAAIGDGTRRVTYFYALGVGSPSTGATTIDFAGQSQLLIIVDIVELTGADNTTPVVQNKTGTWTGTTELGVTLDNNFGDSNNATLGGVFYNSTTGGITPGTGFTELTADQTHSSPNGTQEVEWRVDNDTTVNWTISGSFSNKIGAGFEVKVAGSSPPPAPSTVSVNHFTDGLTDGNHTTDTTASFLPVANEPIFFAVQSGVASGTVLVPTLSACGDITWAQVTNRTFSSTQLEVVVYRGTSTSPSACTVTITYGQTVLRSGWSVDGMTGADPTSPVVQSASNDVFAQAMTVTLASFTNVSNATYGWTRLNSGSAITEGSGFTEIVERNGGTSDEVEFKNSNDTTVDWTYGGGVNKNIGGIAIEVRAAAQNAGAGGWFFTSSQRRRSE